MSDDERKESAHGRTGIKSAHFTHQHAIITMLVQKQHAGLEADGNFLLGIASAAGEEDGLAADAVIVRYY